MKTLSPLLLIALLLFVGVWACQTEVNAQESVCTDEFRSTTLTVPGDSLTDFYTIRLSTSDTIRRVTGYESRTHYYVVLDDSYQRLLARKQEAFRFIGRIGTAVVVREDYLIEADRCHIHKVSGKDEVKQ